VGSGTIKKGALTRNKKLGPVAFGEGGRVFKKEGCCPNLKTRKFLVVLENTADIGKKKAKRSRESPGVGGMRKNYVMRSQKRGTFG